MKTPARQPERRMAAWASAQNGRASVADIAVIYGDTQANIRRDLKEAETRIAVATAIAIGEFLDYGDDRHAWAELLGLDADHPNVEAIIDMARACR